MTLVSVPRQILALGFSGRFHTLCKFPSDQARAEFEAHAPCMLNGQGWLLLSVTEDGYGVLVRRDDCAVLTDLSHAPMVDRYRSA